MTKQASESEFIDKELKHFSVYDVQRSVGHLMDGLKPSMRKVLYACFKRNLTTEIKVAQLSGYTSEHTAYHHGEESLNGTIVGMAQDFIGAGNIQLLQPNGQFGTRAQGGKDSASPRYIFTLLSQLTLLLFPAEDMPLLEYLDDDGTQVEPLHYMPILPVGLLNGVNGIGTGYSTGKGGGTPSEGKSRTRATKSPAKGAPHVGTRCAVPARRPSRPAGRS